MSIFSTVIYIFLEMAFANIVPLGLVKIFALLLNLKAEVLNFMKAVI